MTHLINNTELSLEEFFTILNQKKLVKFSNHCIEKVAKCHDLLKTFIQDKRVIYGVNTGVGGFVNFLIPLEQAQDLQNNLIQAVASNVGPYLSDEFVLGAILARLISLSKGNSGISQHNFLILQQIFNAQIIPCVPSKGSLGASGDLGPLAAIALVATGKWKAKFQGQIYSGKEALEKAGIESMKLSFKEGLSLVNGTSMMVSLAAILLVKTQKLLKLYTLISCLSLEGLKASLKPFNPKVHYLKNHPGQIKIAQDIWDTLQDSKMISQESDIEKKLQTLTCKSPVSTNSPIEDAYSIRCTPQILGPVQDCLDNLNQIITRELNSSNDNPLIIVDENEVFHNGHFHGQYISMSMDQLSVCLTTISNLSDRRIDRFMDKNHSQGLPAFLCQENQGLRLGLMGGQFMATSLTAENRSLCTPCSIQTLTSTGDFQDIVSMGLIAARRANEIFQNLIYVISFELICAAQASDIRDANFLSSKTKKLYKEIREIVPYLEKDICLTDYLENVAQWINQEINRLN